MSHITHLFPVVSPCRIETLLTRVLKCYSTLWKNLKPSRLSWLARLLSHYPIAIFYLFTSVCFGVTKPVELYART